MNWVDWIFVAALLFAFVRGYKAGFLSTILGAIGFIGGGLGGLYLGIHYLHKYSSGVLKFFLLFLAIGRKLLYGKIRPIVQLPTNCPYNFLLNLGFLWTGCVRRRLDFSLENPKDFCH